MQRFFQFPFQLHNYVQLSKDIIMNTYKMTGHAQSYIAALIRNSC